MSREAMQSALELIEPIAHNSTDDPRGKAYEAITALRQALEQPAQQEVDWEKLYRLEVKKKEALAAKYERDTGKQLTRIVPMNQPAQQEPVISTDHGPWIPSTHPREEGETYCKRCQLRYKFFGYRQCEPHIVYRDPPQRTWFGLTDEERHSIREWRGIQKELGPVWAPMLLYLYEAIEAKLKEKNT